MSELLIKINADAKNVKKAFDDIKAQSSDLESTLSTIATVSAVGFATLTAGIGFAVAAFNEAQTASNQLTQALQNQGIFTEELRESYKGYAEELQKTIGLDGDALVAAQATAQGFLGETIITKDLTVAIADLAAKKGIDLNSAAILVAKTIGTSTNALAREGLEISATATKAERYAAVLDFLNQKNGGAAEAATRATRGIELFKRALGEVQEAIGGRFAPIVNSVAESLAKLLFNFSESKGAIDFAASIAAAGLAVTGLGIAIPLAAQAFLTLKAATAAFGVQVASTTLLVRALVGATGIGLLVFAATEVFLNWGAIWPRVTAVFAAFANTVTGLAVGLKEVILGALVLDGDRVAAGLAQVKAAYNQAATEISASFEKIAVAETATRETQNEARKTDAQKRNALAAQEAAETASRVRAENELVKLELAKASQDQIDLKKKEIEILKQLEADKNTAKQELLNQQLEENRVAQDEQRAQDLERNAAFEEERRAQEAEFRAQNIAIKDQLDAEQLAKLQAQVQTEKDIETKIATETLQERIKNRALELEDRKRYGIAVSTINEALRSTEVQGAKAVSGELVALSQSKNNTLKSIGKAAAVANITIATAESAVVIAQKVIQALPFPINIPIAAALAGARIAFGAEQIANVTGAAQGALVGGTGSGDTQPFMLEPGELVAPKKNFEEVVTGVNLARNGADQSAVVDALSRIEEKISGGNTIVVQGDVLTDDSYMDILAQKLSNAIEFRNAKIFGVNA